MKLKTKLTKEMMEFVVWIKTENLVTSEVAKPDSWWELVLNDSPKFKELTKVSIAKSVLVKVRCKSSEKPETVIEVNRR